MKKRKTQKPKPVKAWARMDDTGRVTYVAQPWVNKSAVKAWAEPNEKVVRVTITVED